MNRAFRITIVAAFAATSLSAQVRPVAFTREAVATREIGAVFISMASCCDSVTADLRGPIDSVRRVLLSRAQENGSAFRMIGVSLDWRPEDGWNYLKQFGEFNEVAVGSNWYGMLPEVLMFTDGNVEPVVPQIVIYERMVSRGDPRPTFGPRKIMKRLEGRDEIVSWLRDGAQLP
jgi:hypothetical protein